MQVIKFEDIDIKKVYKLINFSKVKDVDKATLRKYLKLHTDAGFKVVYNLGKDTFGEMGRLFAAGGVGLQSFPKEIRNYLASENYIDIDLENCQPVILEFVARKYGNCPELTSYCENRAVVLKEHNVDKQYVNSMIFCSWFKSEISFFKKIHTFIYKVLVPQFKEDCADLWACISASKKHNLKGNKEGSFVALILQTFERNVLMHMNDFFVEKGLSPDVLIFDGLLVQANEIITEKLLDECNKSVEEAFEGIKLNSRVKEMEDILNIPDDISEKNPNIRFNEATIANYFVQFTDRFLFWNDHFYYCADNGIWQIDEQSKMLQEAVSSEEFYAFIERDDLSFGSTNLYKKLEYMLQKKLVKPKSFNFDQNGDLIVCTNGTYDTYHGVFRATDPTDYVTKSVGYDFDTYDNFEIQEKLQAFVWSLFEDEETIQMFMRMLATCIIGKICYQSFYIWTGGGANGKSAMIYLMNKVLNNNVDGYAGTIDASFFTEKEVNSNSPTPALHGLKGARASFSSEPDTQDGATALKLKSNKIKKISHGNDLLTTRDLHAGLEKWYPVGTLIMACNDIPGFNDKTLGFARTINVIPFQFTFVDKLSGTDEFERQAEDLGYLNCIEYRQQFLRMLIEYYMDFVKNDSNISLKKSKLVDDATKTYFGENDYVGVFIDTYLDITGISDDKLLFKDVYERYKSMNPLMNPQAFSSAMKKKGLKTSKSSTAVYIGLQFKQLE